MNTFHIHFTFSENSGEIRRIKNIDNDLAQELADNVIEIAFISIQHFVKFRKHRFTLNPKVHKKYYFPTLPFSYGNWLFKRLNSLWCSFLTFILCFFYRPKFAIAEFSIGWQAMRFLPSSVNCIIDVHGATREEYEYTSHKIDYRLAETYDFLEGRGMKRAAYIVCQSEAMKKYLLKKYDFLNAAKIFPYKCGADSKLFHIDKEMRLKMRKELEIRDNETLFIYSGGLHKWQKIEDAVSLFVEYCKTHEGKFLILTLDKAGAEKLVNEKAGDIKDLFIVHSTTNNEVYKYLNAADVAFLLRDNVVLNQVASPTKLAEYMFCGLPIISTDVSEYWIDKKSYIFNVDKENIDNLNTFIENTNGEAISQYAMENLSLECDRKNIDRLLNEARK